MKRNLLAAFGLSILVACAGLERSCAVKNAENWAGDWIIVQLAYDGKPFRCWPLKGVTVANEPHSDGIYWLDNRGNLMHISGMYNRVQVLHGAWDAAYAELGIDKETCEIIHNRIAKAVPIPERS